MTDRSTNTREEIRIGQLAIRYLVEGKDSGGSVAIFELDVPAGAKVPIAHSHDAYEETIYGIEGVITFTLEGRKIEIEPATRSASLAEQSTASTTSTPPHPRRSPSSAPAYSPRTTSAKSPPSPKPQQPPSPTPPDPKALAEVMRRHGLTRAP